MGQNKTKGEKRKMKILKAIIKLSLAFFIGLLIGFVLAVGMEAAKWFTV